MKEDLRGKIFPDDNAVNEWLDEQPEEFFQAGIKALEHRWTKCIELQEDYIEKKTPHRSRKTCASISGAIIIVHPSYKIIFMF